MYHQPVFKNRRTLLERAEKFISEIYFTDCNLRGRYGSPVFMSHHSLPAADDNGSDISTDLHNDPNYIHYGECM